jgi:serine/threonine-protein kinase
VSGNEARCQKCGAAVVEDSLFCSKCGADVTAVHGADAATLEVTSLGGPSPRIQSTMRQILRDATLGEYEILSELGRGGMATVFLGHDISLDRKVAIKVMAPHLLEGEGMAERFKLEARTAAQLSHPHIIPIYAVKESESTLFFVMKFVEGKPLDDIIKKMGQLPIPMVKDTLTKVGSALGYAHRRGVVHRDVKPANVMIDEEGTPIVTDFGIAKVAEAKGLTMTGTTIGTPAYMSPEQCEAKPVTGASDQYSLGIVAWEMLTGQTPFAADSAVSIMYKHCHEPLPPLRDFRPDCPPEVLETVTRMLAKDPADRWPSLEATIRKLGATTQDQLDPISRELLELARDTDPRELMAQLSTPRSPMPGVGTGGRSAATAAATAPMAHPATRRSWFPLAAAGFVAVAATAGALAVLQPWQSGGAPTGLEGAGGPGVEGAAPGGATGSETGGGSADANGGGTGGQAAPGTVSPPDGGQDAGGSTTPAGDGSSASGGGAQPSAQPAAASVASVRIDGARSGLEPGDRLALTASALSSGGAMVSGGAPRWSSNDASVGTVTAGGVFTAVGSGSATVSAVIDGVSGSATISVAPASVASLIVQPTSVRLAAGEQATLAAEPRARSGEAVQAGVTWRSSAPGVATVSSSGEVRAVGPGTATITAAAGGIAQMVDVTVTAPVVDARTAIGELITAFARALESGDINEVRRAYPGMTQEQQRNFSGAITLMEQATLDVGAIDERGGVATAAVTGRYVFNDNGRRQTTPVNFRATFERDGSGWRMTGMQ